MLEKEFSSDGIFCLIGVRYRDRMVRERYNSINSFFLPWQLQLFSSKLQYLHFYICALAQQLTILTCAYYLTRLRINIIPTLWYVCNEYGTTNYKYFCRQFIITFLYLTNAGLTEYIVTLKYINKSLEQQKSRKSLLLSN